MHDLEKRTELQSLKYEEILLEFESLKARRNRILPQMYNNNNNIDTSSTHWESMIPSSSSHLVSSTAIPALPPVVVHQPQQTISQDSQTSPSDDSAPQLPKKPTLIHRSTGSQSNENEFEQQQFSSKYLIGIH